MYNYTNNFKLTFDQIAEIEEKIYAMESGCDDIEITKCDINLVLSRRICCFRDKDYNLPQNIFLIKFFKDYVVVGRKLRSVLYAEKKINALNCSMITADMLLGIYVKKGQIDRDIWIEYYPFEKSEKRNVFDVIKHDIQIEITYPFLYREYETGLEEITPPEGWDINPEKIIYLGLGEEHLRKYSIDALKKYLLNNKLKVFDPACSTGEFLYTLKQAYPSIITIGQDLSASMVEYAQSYVDIIYCGDSINTPVKDYSVDIIIFRFLNSEVVSKEYAHRLFNVLIKKIADSGIAVLFGHTALLLESADFENAGYEVLQSIGYSEERDSIFQFYMIKRR